MKHPNVQTWKTHGGRGRRPRAPLPARTARRRQKKGASLHNEVPAAADGGRHASFSGRDVGMSHRIAGMFRSSLGMSHPLLPCNRQLLITPGTRTGRRSDKKPQDLGQTLSFLSQSLDQTLTFLKPIMENIFHERGVRGDGRPPEGSSFRHFQAAGCPSKTCLFGTEVLDFQVR